MPEPAGRGRHLALSLAAVVAAIADPDRGYGDLALTVADDAITHWATQLAGIVATPINWRANGCYPQTASKTRR